VGISVKGKRSGNCPRNKIATGKKVTLKATVTPTDAYNKGVTWKSSNTKVATVSSSGVVTTKKKFFSV